MPVQMIELEEVQMIDLSDEALEAAQGGVNVLQGPCYLHNTFLGWLD